MHLKPKNSTKVDDVTLLCPQNISCLAPRRYFEVPRAAQPSPSRSYEDALTALLQGRQYLIRRLLQDRLLNHTKAPESSAQVGVAPLF
jgi:hypothetical protein